MIGATRIAMIALVLVPLAATAALADSSCTDWLKQTDGSYFRTCVSDSGSQYCEKKTSETSKPFTVSCNS